MTQPTVRVECYSGYKADERPTRLHLGTHSFEITQIEDRWYEPGATFFRLLLEDGDRYVLRHEEPQDVWTIAGYRAGAALTQELHAAYSQAIGRHHSIP
jgi:hypothetical protein